MENAEHERLKPGFYQRASTITSTNATNRDDPGENKIRRKLKQKKSHSKLPPFRKSVQTTGNLEPEFSLATCGKYPCQLVLCLSGISFSLVNAAQTQR